MTSSPTLRSVNPSMHCGGLDTTTHTRRPPLQRTTTDRVVTAWRHAHHVTRRALVAAVATSIAIGATVPVPLVARVAIGFVGTLLATATLVDVHERRLPNRLLAAALAVSSIGWLATPDPMAIVRAVVGLLVGGSLLLIVHVARGVGLGDVKMAAVVGASAGGVSLLAPPVAIAVAATAGATYGLLSRRSQIAFGPALWFGWAIAFAVTSGGVVS
ncbi:MAG: prepilin peptidase [Actinomycetota bacterium]|nr:prepilin peptidase [Actinomycetota bacterium]